MTLATRCPACGTVFRVVQDQLRVSEGWVRCGRCSAAFNAVEAMVEWPSARLAAPPTPAAIESTRTSSSGAAAAPAVETAPLAAVAPEPEPDAAPAPEAQPTSTPGPGLDREPAPTAAVEPPVDHAPAARADVAEAPLIDLPPGVEVVATDGALSPGFSPPMAGAPATFDRVEPDSGFESPAAPQPVAPIGPSIDAASPAPEAPATLAAAPSAAALEPPSAPQPAPSFVLQAERAARWRRPGVRLALGLASMLAASGLVAQVTYTFRDRIAAGAPAARPLLQQACAAIGCRVGEYRQIDALSVESSALVRVDGAPVYRLAVTLRNRATVEVAAPALDLALTDAQGRQIARRVLQMSDLNLPLRSLKPGSELPIQAPLGIAGPVSGYTVEIFYP